MLGGICVWNVLKIERIAHCGIYFEYITQLKYFHWLLRSTLCIHLKLDFWGKIITKCVMYSRSLWTCDISELAVNLRVLSDTRDPSKQRQSLDQCCLNIRPKSETASYKRDNSSTLTMILKTIEVPNQCDPDVLHAVPTLSQPWFSISWGCVYWYLTARRAPNKHIIPEPCRCWEPKYTYSSQQTQCCLIVGSALVFVG